MIDTGAAATADGAEPQQDPSPPGGSQRVGFPLCWQADVAAPWEWGYSIHTEGTVSCTVVKDGPGRYPNNGEVEWEMHLLIDPVGDGPSEHSTFWNDNVHVIEWTEDTNTAHCADGDYLTDVAVFFNTRPPYRYIGPNPVGFGIAQGTIDCD